MKKKKKLNPSVTIIIVDCKEKFNNFKLEKCHSG